MVSHDELVAAIEDGNHTREEIAGHVDVHENHVGKDLRDALDAGVLYREKGALERTNAHTYAYFVADADTDTGGAAAPAPEGDRGEYKAPVNRAYNFADRIPTDANEYIPTNGERDRIDALVDARHEMGTLPRFLISGPSGNGKTTLAEDLAAQREMPFFEVALSNAVYEADLLGTTNVVGEETVWEDGPITRALLSSRERPTVLLIDEANRARSEVANVLMPVLDHRARVQLTGGRGGETIQGDPENLIVIGTINEGREYHGTSEMDHAVKRRFKFKFETTYLGEAYPDREAGLVTERTPVPDGLAELMVEAANDVRELAHDPDATVRTGVPTAALIDWAAGAFGYDKAGLTDPVDEAARDMVELYYDDQAADKVGTLLLAPTGGAPVDAEEFAAWSGDRGSMLTCRDCGWSAYEDQAPEPALDFMECPDCSEPLEWGDE